VHLELAREFGGGLEIQAFSQPAILDGDWQALLREYQELLRDFTGPLACHGAFYDMASATEDARIRQLTWERYLHNLDIAATLGARHVIFHTNFLPMLRREGYRRLWIERQVDFWGELSAEAAAREVRITLENMWDPDPLLLKGVMDALDSPHVGVCLDVCHAFLYNNAHPIAEWLTALAPYVWHVHMNNSRGVIDEHIGLNDPSGAIDYARLLPQLAALPHRPWLVLELDDPQVAAKSLNYTRRILGDAFNT